MSFVFTILFSSETTSGLIFLLNMPYWVWRQEGVKRPGRIKAMQLRQLRQSVSWVGFCQMGLCSALGLHDREADPSSPVSSASPVLGRIGSDRLLKQTTNHWLGLGGREQVHRQRKSYSEQRHPSCILEADQPLDSRGPVHQMSNC